MPFSYWDNKARMEAHQKSVFAMAEEPKIGPDDGCWHCVHNQGNSVCRLSGYNIVHQTGPACARFVAKPTCVEREDSDEV